jgi:4-diphosphocytidyl-2-C-methyl-D-erythritol kinase
MPSAGGRIVELAPAKVNLYLHVVGRRADGYHLLDSLVVFATVGDRVEVSAAEGLQLVLDGRFAADVPASGDNLVLRAARALAAVAGLPADAAIRLSKQLPVAAGIGGGSADAAAALRALVRLWDLPLPAAELAELALSLGADVPMCLRAAPAFIGGIGEVIEPAPPMPACGLLLVNPCESLPTPPVFARRQGAFSAPGRFGSHPPDVRALVELLAPLRNDLTQAAISLVPQVAQVLDVLAELPGILLTRMSGSGATCFGVCETEGAAAAAARALSRLHPEWWVAAASVAGPVICD